MKSDESGLAGIGTDARGGRVRLTLLTFLASIVATAAMAAPAMALSPSVATEPATAIAEKSATLNALVNPNGLETKAYFEYGTTTSYGSKTSEVGVGSGSASVEFNQGVSGLSANTTYHFRIVASNSSGSSQGSDRTFTTAGPPSVTTEAAEPDKATGEAATLNGWVDPNGQSTTYQFEYGTKSGTYTTTVPIPAESAGSSFEGKMVNYKVTGLTRGTTYYFRVTATNAGGKATGTEKSFTTPNVPAIVSEEAIEIGRTEATLRGVINKGGLTTYYWYEYGTTTAYGSKAPASPKEYKPFFATETVSGLEPFTEYHYRLVAENALGTSYGADEVFTTQPLVTLFAGEEQLEVEAPLTAYSSEFFFDGILYDHACEEAEFSGEVIQNPDPVQLVTEWKLQDSGGARCPWHDTYSIYYEVPYTEPITAEYTDEEYNGKVSISKISLGQQVFNGSTVVAECVYNLTLSGSFEISFEYEFEFPLEMTLTGTTEKVSGGSACPGKEFVVATFLVTSNEETVEAMAKP